jgi:hypothetical protein
MKQPTIVRSTPPWPFKPLVIKFIRFVSIAAALLSGAVYAQSMTAEGGTTATAGNTVSMTRIPVKTSTGAVLFKDIQIQFTVDNLGNTTLSAGFPKITVSPPPIPSAFKAGTYKDILGRKYLVSGPAIIPGGRVMWQVQETAPAGFVFEASWATGVVTGHPFQAQLNRNKITSTLYNWGIVGKVNSFTTFTLNVNDVLGAQQIGNQLIFHLYNDFTAIETSTATLTLCATAAC